MDSELSYCYLQVAEVDVKKTQLETCGWSYAYSNIETTVGHQP